jgi:hypothetical protein
MDKQILIEGSRNVRLLDERVLAVIKGVANHEFEFAPDICTKKSPYKFVCSRAPRHDGIHVAIGMDEVVAVWGEVE